MLVLSRREKQVIRIGDDVTITVIQLRGNRVRLGIVAPDHVHILRDELEDRPDEQTQTTPDAA